MLDIPSLCTSLLALPSYVANPVFFAQVGRKRLGTSHVLVRRDNGADTICVMVAKLIDDHLCCGLVMNYNNKFLKLLQDTKNTFILTRPQIPGLGEDFNHFHQTMLAVQGKLQHHSNQG
ncbi:hypothetical protein L208DRAFT_1299539 [Tricholoma matsutake]|nr:hypothetical protein L208DRAFT_1299539 [Tricholoma matsutake 945]